MIWNFIYFLVSVTDENFSNNLGKLASQELISCDIMPANHCGTDDFDLANSTEPMYISKFRACDV